MVFFMLTRCEAFVDQGQQHYEEKQRQRSIAALTPGRGVGLPDQPPDGGCSMKTAAVIPVS
jgi:hypothetical protein